MRKDDGRAGLAILGIGDRLERLTPTPSIQRPLRRSIAPGRIAVTIRTVMGSRTALRIVKDGFIISKEDACFLGVPRQTLPPAARRNFPPAAMTLHHSPFAYLQLAKLLLIL